MILKVDERGRITIPQQIKDMLKIDKEIYLEIDNTKIILSNPNYEIELLDEMIENAKNDNKDIFTIKFLEDYQDRIKNKCFK